MTKVNCSPIAFNGRKVILNQPTLSLNFSRLGLSKTPMNTHLRASFLKIWALCSKGLRDSSFGGDPSRIDPGVMLILKILTILNNSGLGIGP